MCIIHLQMFQKKGLLFFTIITIIIYYNFLSITHFK